MSSELGSHARLTAILVGAALLVACSNQASTVKVLEAQDPSPDPCKVGVTHLAGFTGRLTDDTVSLRTLLVAKVYDSAETARGIKEVSAALMAYPDLRPILQTCRTTTGLSERAWAVETSATAALQPSLAARHRRPDPLARGSQVGRVAARDALVSAAAKAAGDQLAIKVTVAADPAGSNPPEIPLGPFATWTPDFQAFADRLWRRWPDFAVLLADETAGLTSGIAGEVRRIGRRITTYADTEITWLNRHKPEACYGATWRAVLAAWSDLKTAGNEMVDKATTDAVHSMQSAANHLATLHDRDYVRVASARCVTAPAPYDERPPIASAPADRAIRG